MCISVKKQQKTQQTDILHKRGMVDSLFSEGIKSSLFEEGTVSSHLSFEDMNMR